MPIYFLHLRPRSALDRASRYPEVRKPQTYVHLGKSQPFHVSGPIYKMNPLPQQRRSTAGSREAASWRNKVLDKHSLSELLWRKWPTQIIHVPLWFSREVVCSVANPILSLIYFGKYLSNKELQWLLSKVIYHRKIQSFGNCILYMLTWCYFMGGDMQ